MRTGSANGTTHHSNTGAVVKGIIGGVVGGVALVILLGVILLRRRRARSAQLIGRKSRSASSTQPRPFPYSSVLPRNTTGTTMNRRTLVRSTVVTVGDKDTPNGPSPDITPVRTGSTSRTEEAIISEVRGLRTEIESLRVMIQGITVDSNERPPTYRGSMS